MVLPPSMLSNFGSPIRVYDEETPNQQTHNCERKAELPKTKKRALVCLLFLASLIVLNTGYNLLRKNRNTPISRIFTANIIYDLWTRKVTAMKEGTVAGILYNEENSCALINRELVHEGDITNGIKIIRIEKDKVEFEKNDLMWTQKLLANPNTAWKTAK